jgi:pyruvate kinase
VPAPGRDGLVWPGRGTGTARLQYADAGCIFDPAPAMTREDLSQSKLLLTLTKRQATPDLVRRLVDNGISGVRLIAKGYRPAEYRANYDDLMAAGSECTEEFRVIVDLPGGKPRVSSRADDFRVERGDYLLLRSEADDLAQTGDARVVATVGLMPFVTGLKIGDRVLVSDGAIQMQIVQIDGDGVLVRVLNSEGMITASRSINLPDSGLRYSSRGDDDGVLVAFEKESTVEVAVSMVASERDVMRVHTLLPSARVLAKVESRAGLENISAIAEAADEVIIARADLSIEMPLGELGSATETILAAAEASGKPCVLGAGFLETLQRAERPSIAEVSDVWHYHRRGVRQFLLSGTLCVTNPLEAAHYANHLLRHFDDVAAEQRR